METFKCKLITPEGVLFDDSIWQVSACNLAGWFGIRAHHANFYTTLNACKLEIVVTDENRKHFLIVDGFLEFQQNSCTILCEIDPSQKSAG